MGKEEIIISFEYFDGIKKVDTNTTYPGNVPVVLILQQLETTTEIITSKFKRVLKEKKVRSMDDISELKMRELL